MNSLSFLDVDPSILKTEERIIVAAIKVFAENSIHAATVRMIAQEAKVQASSITYHFTTKENLYQEVIRRILHYASTSILHYVESPAQPLTLKSARKELLSMIEKLTDWHYGSPHIVTFAKIISREHFSPSPVYGIIYNEFFSKAIARMTTIVHCLIKGNNKVDKGREAALQTFSIFGQIFGFRLQREMLVRSLGFTGFSADEIAEIKDLLLRNISRQLEVTL